MNINYQSAGKESLITQLSEALRCLPGVGPKSAQRMVMYLLERDRGGAKHLANSLQLAMDKVNHCQQCRNFTEENICQICSATNRNSKLLCVVENPGDVIAIEQTGHYKGQYFVLMGNLSPIDGIGPDEIGMSELKSRCGEGTNISESSDGVEELILALSSSVEGEATSHYISELLNSTGIQITRIAQGIPLGGELEYVDGSTLVHAINGRKAI